MNKELIAYIKENDLSPFNKSKTSLKLNYESIFKTKDAKSVHTRVLNKISENFIFKDTINLFSFFEFTDDFEKIKKRQDFFKNIEKTSNDFLKELKIPKKSWKPKYGIIVVTEDETNFSELKKLDCPVQFLGSQYDIEGLENNDIIQVLDCEQFSQYLEQLPQTVFLNSLDEVYLERYLELLSGYSDNIEILIKNKTNEPINEILDSLTPLLDLIKENPIKLLKKQDIEYSLDIINEKIESKIKDTNINGTTLLNMLSKGKLPEEFNDIIKNAIKESNLPEDIFNMTIPVSIDEISLEKTIKKESANINTSIAEKIKKHSKEIRNIPRLLKELDNNLLLFDFCSGISNSIKDKEFPQESLVLSFLESDNIFLKDSQKITFNLSEENRCSILTGANSGGKTTLLEHIIQLMTIFQIGLPRDNFKTPIFTDIYYFAKTKGKTGKGAFENLLSQMDKIKPGKKTLILADEIEAVTEPGVAGKIISATAEYFINKDCFLIIATHLGEQIEKTLPQKSRIDGIEAKGLDEFFELIVDHNPVLGKLASSTPELIVEKMANSEKTEYFRFLYDKIKK
jgi:DNA mismatch repair protein MutS2